MLRHRLIAGTILAAAAGGILIGDGYLAPFFPCLLCCVFATGYFSTRELVSLIPEPNRPSTTICTLGVLTVLLANWAPALSAISTSWPAFPVPSWGPIVTALGAAVLGAFLNEMARYRGPGTSVTRVAHTVLVIAYLGLLPTFFIKLRWLHLNDSALSTLAMTLTIFVPKVGDIGAYFIGRMFGRHQMAPLLSPKKTWEGFVGGITASILTAVGLSFVGPIFRYGVFEAIGFGLTIGIAGVLGDLAESKIKRDAQAKDAGRSIPGFGGILDVIDSVLFAGPVAYWWFSGW